MRQRTTPQANPVRHPADEPGLGATPRNGSAVVTPTLTQAERPEWLLAAVGFAVVMMAAVAVSL
jgi:hypothetical protein